MSALLRGRLLAGLLVLSFIFTPVSLSTAQAGDPEPIVLFLEDEPTLIIWADPNDGSHIQSLPPEWAIEGSTAKTATIIVEYVDRENWKPQAISAFEYAKGIWESLVVSPVPIRVRAEWIDMKNDSILGGAGPVNLVGNFSGAPYWNTWFVPSLANSLAKKDLYPTYHDVNAQFNSGFPGWYFGTDGAPAGKHDFASVVLHEIGHGLGFYDSFNVASGEGSWGAESAYPNVFDRFVANGAGQSLISFPNDSPDLAYQLQSNNIYFTGSAAVRANGGGKVPLYAPSRWASGSSIAHLGEAFNDTPNALMTYSLKAGEKQHYPGPVTLGIFEDLGWKTGSVKTFPDPTPRPNFNNHIYIPLLKSGARN